MANLNYSFLKFCDKVRLSKSKKDNLITSREANRDRIKKYFQDILKEKIPQFFQQGSFSFKTTVNPIDGDYDVDDGVYLQNLENDFLTNTEPKTAQNWIAEAVKEATKADVIYKPSCIRLVYANDYHLDLPVYGVKDNITYLAHCKSNTWIENDIKGFNDWFYDRLNNSTEQLRRNIIYLKAWADFNSYYKITGILITVLVCNNNISIKDRDDESLYETLKKLLAHLKIYRSVNMPVVPFDNLLEKYNYSEVDSIINSFSNLKDACEKSFNEKDEEKAANHLIKEFGDRFILVESKEKNDKVFAIPIINSIPKPWCY